MISALKRHFTVRKLTEENKLNVQNELDLPKKKQRDPNGIRTRITAVKGRCPGPLDDRVTKPGNIRIATAQRKANWQPLSVSRFERVK